MAEIAFSFAIALAVTALSGLFLLPALRRLKFGQSIREEGPKWHMSKSGTPTMGGIMFIAGILPAIAIVGRAYMGQGDYSHFVIFGFALVFGGIGFIDDFFKVRKKQNLGLTSIQKLGLQLAVSAAFIALLRYMGYLTTDIYVPFFDVTLRLDMLAYTLLALPVVAGMVNAVNLTDGVDGLCTGVTLPVAVFFTAIAFLWNRGGLTVFSAALAGALVGFLIYNFHPAKVFMGDTGSLFLGGAVCGMAFVSGVPLLMIIVGAAYIWEMVSVILQVLYFKLTKGKRLFKMSPFHHHLEMKGWGEIAICAAFFAATVALGILAWVGVSNYLNV
ncbi:MAG: phospho-N-acetylmuramoyl-pentapeptide-transferase [Oscillospiraceae bacterium]|jgi:phospho-N-acetylmuramoyl-pentapeptide-transferase|nr:phospho-N-acetylmuramoyl-pentapeptide-transferase [Oscillospiraceae bacterium]